MLTVACVLWVGTFGDRRYSPTWVHRLKAMVERNLSVPHRFVCLSNISIRGVETIPLHKNWRGWWSKVELFDPAHDFDNVLYLDLDVLVTGDLAPIAAFNAPIAFAPPHHVLMGLPEPAPTNRVIPRYQTSVMVWSGDAGREIYERFDETALNRFRSDQDWIAHLDPGHAIMPKAWFRKLRQCTEGPPAEARVVFAMPDKNDVAAEKYPWVREVWLGEAERAHRIGEPLRVGQG